MICNINVPFCVIFKRFSFRNATAAIGTAYFFTFSVTPANEKSISVCLNTTGLCIGGNCSFYGKTGGTIAYLGNRNFSCSVVGSIYVRNKSNKKDKKKNTLLKDIIPKV
jgi:hypothetical protein